MAYSATGLVPVGYLNGAPWNGQANMYYIVSTDPNAYYIGDTVLSAATGSAQGVSGVIKATAGTETPRGVIVGVLPVNPVNSSLVGSALSLETTSIPATKTRDYYVMVADDPQTIFEATDDGLTVAKLVSTSCNKNCSLTIAAPTSPVQQSATVLLSTSIDVTATLIIKLLGLAKYEGNQFVTSGVSYRWLCCFNVHELKSVGTLGV